LSFVLRLENAFILAKDTGRSEEFERSSTPVTILYKKLPHLADRWAKQRAKQSLKTGDNQTFQNFMEWLKLKQKISEQIGRQKAIEALRNPKGLLKTAATHVTMQQHNNGGGPEANKRPHLMGHHNEKIHFVVHPNKKKQNGRGRKMSKKGGMGVLTR
jgi:hypothetical protein